MIYNANMRKTFRANIKHNTLIFYISLKIFPKFLRSNGGKKTK